MGIYQLIERLFVRIGGNEKEPLFNGRRAEGERRHSRARSKSPHDAGGRPDFDTEFDDALKAARKDGRPVMSGTIEVVGLDEIKQQAGAEWTSLANEARRIAENEIRRVLGPRDLFRAYDDCSFAICFVNLDEEQAKTKARTIAKDIKTRIMQAHPLTSSRLSVRRFVTQIPTETFDNLDTPLGELLIETMARLSADARIAARNHRRKLLNGFHVVFAPVWNPRDEITGINRCVLDLSPGCTTLTQFQAIADRDQMASTLSDLDRLVMTRSIEVLHRHFRNGDVGALLIPMSFQTLNFDEDQGELLDLLAAVPEIYREPCILEITAIPARASLETVVATCTLVRPFAKRLVVEINGRADLIGPELAEQVWGVAWNIYGMDAANLDRESVRATIGRAHALGLQSFAHGANTIGLAVGAVDAGFRHIDGTAIHLFSDTPRAPVRLRPIRRAERSGRRS